MQRVLGLAVKGKQHIIFIDFLVINAVDVTPNGRAALCRGEIFDGMERKIGEIGTAAAFYAVSDRSERMGSVGHDDYAAECLLNIVFRGKKGFFYLNDFINAVIVAHNSPDVDGNYHLGLIGYCVCKLFSVHFKCAGHYIHHFEGGSHMADNACSGGIGV